MTRTVTAIFDGDVLRPETPLDLEPNVRYIVTIETAPLEKTKNMHVVNVTTPLLLSALQLYQERQDKS